MNKSLAKLVRFFEDFLERRPRFYGSCEVNFHDGNVPNINIKESVRLPEDEKCDQ